MNDKGDQTTDLSQVEFVTFEEYQEPGQDDGTLGDFQTQED